jgi:hypothetical protein
MRFHFDFSASQILWTLTFAAELVLLIVLMGRDRSRRFPWFTANVVVMALMLLVSRLLFGRMPAIVTSSIFLALSSIAAVIGLLVVVELARRAFAGAPRAGWLVGVLASLIIAITVLVIWGPWPARSAFTGGPLLVMLRSLQLAADKGAVLGALLAIELGIAIVFFGRRFQGGWRTHAQQIVIGLSTAGIAQLAVRVLWQSIATRAKIHTQAEYQHLLDLRDRIYNANNLVFVLVLVWWIAWLWLDEPGKIEPGEYEPGAGESGENAAQGVEEPAFETPAEAPPPTAI